MKIESSPTGGHAAKLIEFVAALPAHAIPKVAFDNARRCLLDAIGCGLFGAGQPWSQIMSAQMFAEKSQGASTVFGYAAPLAAPAAALCNGTAIHGFELDDLLSAAVIHPGTVTVPALLAAAEGHEAIHRVAGTADFKDGVQIALAGVGVENPFDLEGAPGIGAQ